MASKAAIRLFALLAIAMSGEMSWQGVAVAEQGTEQEREACTPDVFRLCGRFIPDEQRITTCLRNAGPRLSPACYAVFNPPQQQNAPQSTTGRLRGAPPQGPTPVPPQPPSDDDDDDQ